MIRKPAIFGFFGQSNIPGTNLGGAPPVENGYTIPSGTVQTIALNFDKSSTHAFANKYFKGQHEKTPYVIMRAASGASATTNTAINWSPSGTLRSLFKNDLDNAKLVLGKSDVDGGILGLGEADAEFMRTGVITRSECKVAFQSLVNWWKLNYPTASLYIIQTGFDTEVGVDQFWIDMQDIQYELSQENSNVFIASELAKTFINNPGLLMADSVHWSQFAENLIGEDVANFILSN